MEDLIRCENASFGYDSHAAISGISFSLQKGAYLCIIGENGAGKSTLLKGLLRLLKPLAGNVVYGSEFDSYGVGWLDQTVAAKKDFPAGVREIVLSGFMGKMGLRPFYTQQEKQIASRNMERVHITDLQRRCFRELSSGQQRRALIARALCATEGSAAPLLALDEPSAGLDPSASDNLYGLLAEANKEMGLTIVMISHDIDAALKYATHILQLRRTQVFFGDPSEYRELGGTNV